jgi:hypothetical protein
MASGVFYQSWKEYLTEGVNCGSDSFKVALSNSAPNTATHTLLADATEISAGNGYTAGGNAAATSSSAQSGGTFKLVLADPAAWTGSGAGMATFRYVILYDDTLAGDPLVMYWDYGSGVTLASGETFTADLSAANGVFTLA